MRLLAVLALVVAVLLLGADPAVADLESDLVEVGNQIDDFESAIEAAEGTRTEFAATVLETARQLEAAAEEMLAAEQRLSDTEAMIALSETRIVDLVEQMNARQALVLRLRLAAGSERKAAEARAVEVYMAVHADVSDCFFGSFDPDSEVGIVYADRVQNVTDRVITEYELHRYQEQQEAARLGADRVEAEVQTMTLKIQRSERQAIAEEVAAHVVEVGAQLVEHKSLLARMENEIAHFEGEMADLAREEELIQALIEQRQRDEGEAPGLLLRPVPGAVSSGFGWRIHPIYGGSRLHNGWDMNGSCGDPMVAAADGRVFYSGWKGGYGNTVMIDHGGGLSTLYGHQSSVGVVYGQQVVTGEVIGWVGTTGTSTACHLHWEVRVSGDPVDPSPLV